MILECESAEAVKKISVQLAKMGFRTATHGELRLAVVEGIDDLVKPELFVALPGVKKVLPLKEKHKLVAQRPESTVIEIKDKKIGGKELFVIAGPCSIESKEQMMACARAAAENGAQGLRGGAFKPRTSPYEFQGLGLEGLKILVAVAEQHNLITVTEVLDAEQVELAAPYVDILQVGTRNMHNFELLKALGKVNNTVLLKRGFAATYQELLLSAEYIISGGNPNVILCERGIRTFETYTRNTLDLNAIPALQEMTHLPIIADPSHGTGRRSLVGPMASASVAAGADGVIIEMHPEPHKSLTDAQQTIDFQEFAKIMREMQAVRKVVIRDDR